MALWRSSGSASRLGLAGLLGPPPGDSEEHLPVDPWQVAAARLHPDSSGLPGVPGAEEARPRLAVGGDPALGLEPPPGALFSVLAPCSVSIKQPPLSPSGTLRLLGEAGWSGKHQEAESPRFPPLLFSDDLEKRFSCEQLTPVPR